MEAMLFSPTITLTLQVFGELKFGEEEVAAALQEITWRDGKEYKGASSVRYLPEKSGAQGEGTTNRNFGVDHVFEVGYDVRLCDRFGETKAFRKFTEGLMYHDDLHKLPGLVLVSAKLRLESGQESVGIRGAEQLFGVYKYLQAQAV